MRSPSWRSVVRTARDRALASDRILLLAGRGSSPTRTLSPFHRLLPPIRQGLPVGLHLSVIERSVAQLGAAPVDRCAHVALSGWKSETWTSRVFVLDTEGARHSIVAKVTDYADHVPAFDGLPFEPGRPEYGVLRSVLADPRAELASWMPRPLLAEPIDDHRYVFVFEDVGQTHSARSSPADMLRAIAALSPMQSALRAVAVPDHELLDLQPEHHVDTLVEYVRSNLALAPEPGAADLVRRADELVELCATPSWADAAVGPVHGDPNRSNVLFARRGDDLVFIDWEWAGRGLPHVDLACLTKVVPQALEDEAVVSFADNDLRFTHDQHRELHQRAKLHRSLLDASFLAAQRAAKPSSVRFDLAGPIRRAHAAARAIADEKKHR